MKNSHVTLLHYDYIAVDTKCECVITNLAFGQLCADLIMVNIDNFNCFPAGIVGKPSKFTAVI